MEFPFEHNICGSRSNVMSFHLDLENTERAIKNEQSPSELLYSINRNFNIILKYYS